MSWLLQEKKLLRVGKGDGEAVLTQDREQCLQRPKAHQEQFLLDK